MAKLDPTRLAIGTKIFVHDQDNIRRSGSSTREAFDVRTITAENRLNWLVPRYESWNPTKSHGTLRINKKTGELLGIAFLDEADVKAFCNDIEWAAAHRYRIRDCIDRVSITKMREIAKLIGYDEKTKFLTKE
jgi:hypothetical protein